MIQHIMLWNYREEVTGEERARLVLELSQLPSRVPSLIDVRYGPIVGGRNQTFGHCFVMRFNDVAGLAEYNVHPAHLHFSGPFREACAVQVAADFEERE